MRLVRALVAFLVAFLLVYLLLSLAGCAQVSYRTTGFMTCPGLEGKKAGYGLTKVLVEEKCGSFLREIGEKVKPGMTLAEVKNFFASHGNLEPDGETVAPGGIVMVYKFSYEELTSERKLVSAEKETNGRVYRVVLVFNTDGFLINPIRDKSSIKEFNYEPRLKEDIVYVAGVALVVGGSFYLTSFISDTANSAASKSIPHFPQ